MKKLRREVSDIQNSDHPEYKLEVVDDNLFRLNLLLRGPPGTPYEGGEFKVIMELSIDYPLKAPTVRFQTKIFHPNISDDGTICLSLLKPNWTPSTRLTSVINELILLLQTPDERNGLNNEACALLQKDPNGFNSKAREWTQKFAKK